MSDPKTCPFVYNSTSGAINPYDRRVLCSKNCQLWNKLDDECRVVQAGISIEQIANALDVLVGQIRNGIVVYMSKRT